MSSTKRRGKYYGQSDAIVWPADHPVTTRPRAKKDTKRWCRGKVGVEHRPVIEKACTYGGPRPCRVAENWHTPLIGSTWACYHDERCAACGKVLRPWLRAGECPDRPSVELAAGTP